MSPASRALVAPLGRARFHWHALFVAGFALAAASVLALPINHDVSWYVAMAGQLRHGARLYVDIVEVSPPLIAWLNLPASAMAEWLGADAGAVFRAQVLALALGSVLATARIARLLDAPEWPARVVLCFATITAAGYDFGQREHLALLLALPYVAMAAVRAARVPHSRAFELAAAAAAAVGLSIKPHFAVVALLVESWVLLRRRAAPDGSAWTLAAVAALYVGAVLVFTPEYVAQARILSQIYAFGYLDISPIAFLGGANFQIGSICIALALVVRPAPRELRGSLLAAAAAFALAALAQAKGWSYHWYPFLALGLLLLALAAAAVLRHRAWFVPLAAVLVSALALATAPRRAVMANPFLPVLAPIVHELGGGPVLVFSNTWRVSYPLLTQPGLSNASRLPTAALLSAAIAAKHGSYEAHLRGVVAQDMQRQHPRVLICEDNPEGLPPGFDFISYMAQEPAFAREVPHYSLVRTVGRFRIYRRRD
jgi:hypothetical protein